MKCLIKKTKLVKRGRGLGHVTYFSNFGTPLISLERLKIQISNFACRLFLRDTKSKYQKFVKSGRGLGHATHFSNFGTPLISLERLKLQTPNFAHRLILRDTKAKNEKLVKSRCGLGNVTYFFNCRKNTRLDAFRQNWSTLQLRLSAIADLLVELAISGPLLASNFNFLDLLFWRYGRYKIFAL